MKQKIRKNEIENEKKELIIKINDCKEFSTHLNEHLKLKREKFLVLSQYLNENLIDVKEMDELVCTIDKTPKKCVIFSGIDIDALSFKRKNYKNDLENFKKFFIDSSMLEKEIYDEIIRLVYFQIFLILLIILILNFKQNEQSDFLKSENISSQNNKHLLSLKESDLLNDSLEDLEFS
jgi:hypothetical protein